MLVITGDIASNCQVGAYQQLDQLLLAKNKQALWLPGNHDDLQVMQQHLTQHPFLPVFESGNWAILMLDSSKSGQPGGEISSAQLQKLERHLARLKDKYLLVAMHHSPVSVNSQWLDCHQISNDDQLHKLLTSHGNVKAVINGHIHQQYETDWNGLAVYSVPSTCFQFAPRSHDFVLSDQPPAYRWFNLHPQGHIETGVKAVENFRA